MKRAKLVGCLCLLSGLVGVAYGATKLDFEFGSGVLQCFDPNCPIDGMAIINYAAGSDKTVVQAIFSGLPAPLGGGVELATLEVVGCGDPFVVEVDSTGAATMHGEIYGADCTGSELVLRGSLGELWGTAN